MASLPWELVVFVLSLILSIALLAMDERNRRKFLTREESKGIVNRMDEANVTCRQNVEAFERMCLVLNERTGTLEEKVAVLTERQTQQWDRISEQVAETMKRVEDVVRRLEVVSKDIQRSHKNL